MPARNTDMLHGLLLILCFSFVSQYQAFRFLYLCAVKALYACPDIQLYTGVSAGWQFSIQANCDRTKAAVLSHLLLFMPVLFMYFHHSHIWRAVRRHPGLSFSAIRSLFHPVWFLPLCRLRLETHFYLPAAPAFPAYESA